MSRKRYVLLKSITIWLVLSSIWFCSVEPLLSIALPNTHEVEHWILAEILGIAIITFLTAIFVAIALIKRYRRNKTICQIP
jgi:heme/copper-type cytochrome/quinol oxidase subunit 2